MAEYIEREALLNALGFENTKRAQVQPNSTFGIILSAPAADVAPVRRGRWIYGEDVDIQCSACGADALTEGDYRQVKSRYCPNCGAKMDLEDEA